MTDFLKVILLTAISNALAYLSPIHNAMQVLAIVFIADMIFAMIADIVVLKNSFKPKKFLTAFFYVAVYLFVIVFVYVVGEKMGDEEQSLYIDKTITYIFIGFYCVNILKNLKIIAPDSKPIAFLYFMFGFEFMKRVPNLYEFMNGEKENKIKTQSEKQPEQ